MRNRYVFLADVTAIALAAWGAFAFRFGWFFISDRPEFPLFLGIAILVKVLVFYAFGLYQRYWRYATFWDLMAVALANVAASLLFAVAIVGIRLTGVIQSLSRSVLPVDLLLTLALTAALRASLRVMAETKALRSSGAPTARRVLVVGAGDAGVLVVREMARNPHLGMKPIGFLDDEPSKWRKKIAGLPVLGPLSTIDAVTKSRPVDEVMVAMPTAGGTVVRAVVEHCRRLGIPSRVMPGVYELLDGQVSVNLLRNVEIGDLLRRPQIVSRPDSGAYLQDRVVVITGAGGSIGSELARQVAHARPAELVLLGHGENSIFDIMSELRVRLPNLAIRSCIVDVRDRDRVNRVFRSARPSVVFHAAAHKHVPLMEENVEEAISNNVLGTRNIVEAATAAGIERLVMVSTDKAVAPNSIMGASKRIAEMIVTAAATQHGLPYAVVRFGNVLGSRGSVVPIFKGQIARGGPVTVTHPDVRRYFMTIPEAVHLVLQAGGLGRGGELFVLDMGEPVKLLDLARDIIRLSGFDENEVPIVFTGLRQGEKLDEALWEEGAVVAPTGSPDIRVVTESAPFDADRLKASVDRMIDAAARHDRTRILRELRECVATLTWAPARDPLESGADLRVVRPSAIVERGI